MMKENYIVLSFLTVTLTALLKIIQLFYTININTSEMLYIDKEIIKLSKL